MLTFDLQRVREKAISADIVGYDVEGPEGTIGEVEEKTEELAPSFISVDTMPSVLGRRVILPASVVEQIDHRGRKVYVDRRHEHIRDAPRPMNEETEKDDAYLTELRRYYGPAGAGYQEPHDAWTDTYRRTFAGARTGRRRSLADRPNDADAEHEEPHDAHSEADDDMSDRIDEAALRQREKPIRERMRLPEHGVRDLLIAAAIYAAGFLVLVFLIDVVSSKPTHVPVVDVVAVIVLAFFFETIDSSAGMGFGTALSPVLLVLGYSPLQVVPVLVAAQAFTSAWGGIMHSEFENIEFSWRPLNKATKTMLLIAVPGTIGACVSAVLGYLTLSLPDTVIETYIAILVVAMAALVATNALRGRRRPYRPRRLPFFGAVAGLNKGIGSGGYGPVVTLGGVLSGVIEKTSVAITTMSEGFASSAGAISFLVISAFGAAVDWRLLPWLWLGAFPASVVGPYTVRVLPVRVWRYFVPVYAAVIATVLLVKTYGGL
jgi:uncharacterized membrane protein YfcA